jgi:hypothetical protein
VLHSRRVVAAWLAAGFAACLVAVVAFQVVQDDHWAGPPTVGRAMGIKAAAADACQSPTVSAPTTVLDANTRTRLGLTEWPDTQPGVLRGLDGSYYFISAGAATTHRQRQEQVVTAGSLDTTAGAGLVHRAGIAGVPPGYEYVGGGQVYREPKTGTIIEVVHLERRHIPGTVRPYYTEIGLARVDPSTYQATFVGLILRPTITYEAAREAGYTVDLGTPSLVARDGYLYAYYSEFSPSGDGRVVATALSVARTPLAAALVAARDGTVSTWFKYWHGGWTSPSLGGPAADLQPGQAPSWEPSAAYDPALDATLIVAPDSTSRIIMSQSRGTVTGWGEQKELWIDPGKFDAYPVIVGMGEDPAAPGRSFYVYYLQWQSANAQDWTTAVQLRRTITCANGP